MKISLVSFRIIQEKKNTLRPSLILKLTGFIYTGTEKLKNEFIPAVSYLSQILRDEFRQPSVIEYLAFQLAYYKTFYGGKADNSTARCLGSPGFRPYTQTHMAITDPGEGHVRGTTRFNDWMKGTTVHMEHLERPHNLPRENIESYRIPSLHDFARVRRHVGPSVPTTYYVGRFIKDSGDFDEDFLKHTSWLLQHMQLSL